MKTTWCATKDQMFDTKQSRCKQYNNNEVQIRSAAVGMYKKMKLNLHAKEKQAANLENCN